MKHWNGIFLKFLIAACVVFCPAQEVLSQSSHVPLEHWVYPFLDRLQTRGAIKNSGFQTRPYSRDRVASLLAQAVNTCRDNPRLLSAPEQKLLEQLKGEFHEELSSLGVSADPAFYERHTLSGTGPDYRFHGDLYGDQRFYGESRIGENSRDLISHTTLGGRIRGVLKETLGFYLFAKNTLRKGESISRAHFNPGEGLPVTISGENAYSDDASAYLVWKLPWFVLQFGRDRVQWGPGFRGSLMLSGQAPRFEMIRLQGQWGRVLFTSIHGKLQSDPGPRYVAAHRLEIQVSRRLYLGAGEAVIYGGREVEPAYLNPIMPYHVAEHHLGDRDNNTLGVDITAFPWNGFKIYAELFIDDFTMAKNPFTYYGNKFAVLAGARWISPLGLSRLDITGEYARIEPYVYTHRRPINVYQHYDQSLGHWLGPNSDDLTLQCQLLLTGNWRLRASAERTRRGEGDIETPHRDEVGFRKKFLSGVIETSWQWSLGTTIQLFRDGFLSFEYGYLLQENAERISGRNDYHHRVRLFFTVDY